jgi:hypothetical protein
MGRFRTFWRMFCARLGAHLLIIVSIQDNVMFRTESMSCSFAYPFHHQASRKRLGEPWKALSAAFSEATHYIWR